jgi:5-carboxymethyl-2-hydroxymuconate isomerase
MPHITLEYSANVDQDIAFPQLFAEIHQTLSRVAGIAVANCKSRAVRRDVHFVAQGTGEEAFVHVEIRLLAGREPALRQEIGQRTLEILQNHFARSLARWQLQITVELVEMDAANYFKATSGAA